MELERYLVELERPTAGWGGIQEAAARAREAAGELRGDGLPVRFLRSVYVPEDDTCFFLYEGPSREAVQLAVQRAVGLGGRVVESVAAAGDL